LPSLIHADEFDAALDEAIERFKIIDELEDCLAYSPCVTEWYGEQLPPLFELGPYMRSPWRNVPNTQRMPPSMGNVAWALLDYEKNDDQLLALFQDTLEKTPGAFVRYEDAPKAHEEIRTLLAERRKLLDYAAALNFQTTLGRLELDLRTDNDEQTVLRLVQLDKTALYSARIRSRIIQKQYEGDAEFFNRLGKAIAKPVLNGSAHWHKAVVIAGYFWNEFFSKEEWPVNRVFDLFKAKGILARQDKLAAFRFRLNRAGLKKPRYNRKPSK